LRFNLSALDRILIIEDDPDISGLIDIHLRDMGFHTDISNHGIDGLQLACSNRYSMIILDIMLPGMDGFEVCRRMRVEKVNTPVLMLTARTEELDRVLGLEIGADDYLTKPFSVREMSARVKAILRRDRRAEATSKPKDQPLIEAENFSLDVERRIVKVNDEIKALSPKEFDLLVLLASNDGRTYSRQQLLSLIWGDEFDGFEHTVNSHINRLRMKIEQDVQHPEFILTTWGVGYRFKDLSN
jgi:two-component system, OmpR family, alkaline phosphatase synthesis response regulator PhoP